MIVKHFCKGDKSCDYILIWNVKIEILQVWLILSYLAAAFFTITFSLTLLSVFTNIITGSFLIIDNYRPVNVDNQGHTNLWYLK